MKSPFDGNIDKTSGDFQLRISLENCFAYGGRWSYASACNTGYSSENMDI